MASTICLLNLDTGDFINLGKLFFHPNPVEEVGYEGGHYLLNYLPNIPYGPGGENERENSWVKTVTHQGHALSAFLACSIDCRLILIKKEEIINRIRGDMECFGNLGSADLEDGVVEDNGKFISEGTQFYRKRLAVNPQKKVNYEYIDEADEKRILAKKQYYSSEITRALEMNIVSKVTGIGYPLRTSPVKVVYSMGQKPPEPSI